MNLGDDPHRRPSLRGRQSGPLAGQPGANHQNVMLRHRRESLRKRRRNPRRGGANEAPSSLSPAMPDQLTTPPLDRRLAELARRQHGVVSHGQLVELGLGTSAIGDWAKRGRLHRVHRGVYAMRYPTLTRNGRFMAAVLACGEKAALSHFSAAVLWGMLNDRGGTIHVTADGRRRRPGLVVHEAALGDEETRRRAGIPVTTPARTLIDLADVAPRRTLERAIDEAEYLRLDCTGLAPRRGRSGSGRLTSVLAAHTAGSTRPRGKCPYRGVRVRLRLARAAPDRRDRRRRGARHKGGDEAGSAAGRRPDGRRVACLAADLRAAVP
jgi:hypothetical protein